VKTVWFLAGLGFVAATLSFPWPFPLLKVVLAWLVVTAFVFAGRFFVVRGGALPGDLRVTLWSPAVGFLLGGLALAILLAFSVRDARALSRLRAESFLPIWKRIVIAFDSAILEEIIFRWFLLSAIVWLLTRVRGGAPRTKLKFWVSNLIVAAAFGAAHLPAWAAMVQVSVALAAFVVVINMLASLALGSIFWKWGIASAILSHFAADLAVHGAGAALVRGM
jgi:membrane protease YdiL (CAAX protease family)